MFAVVGLGAVAACGSSSSSSTTTTEAPSVVSSVPPPASSVPTSLQAPCSAMAATIGISELQPKNTGNWPAERSRIVTDAQREAGLLGTAATALAADRIAPYMTTMQTYASWIATTVQGSDSFSAAVSALNEYPDKVGVSLAIASVDTWKAKNC
jgi:hypothetical protein